MQARNRFQLTGSVLLAIVLAVLAVGGWFFYRTLGVLFSVAVFFAVIFWASQYLYTMYELESRSDAFRALLTFMFGINVPHIIVGEGRIIKKSNSTASKMGGPGVLIVKPDSAAVTEMGTKHWVHGPGLKFIANRFENVIEVIDLRPQVRNGTVRAMTKDGFEIEVDFFVGFQIDPYIGEPITTGTYPYCDEAVIRAVYDSKQVTKEGAQYWHERVPGVVYANVQEMIASHHLDDFFAPNDPDSTPRDKLKADLKQATIGPARAFGAKVNFVNFGTPKIPDETTRKYIERYAAELQSKIKETEARAQRHAIEIIIEALDNLDEQAQIDHVMKLRFIEALERISKDPSAKVIWPWEPDLRRPENP
jgi:regulator of protease activity HflC (stomatin/prohibitin superfamily)